ncbi:hypothetical protein [Enterococcus sp. AZ072]
MNFQEIPITSDKPAQVKAIYFDSFLKRSSISSTGWWKWCNREKDISTA